MRDRNLNTTDRTQSHSSQQTRKAPTRGSAAPNPQYDPLAKIMRQTGNSASSQAAMLNRAPSLASRSLLQLQRQHGNRYVQRVLAISRQGEESGEVSPEVEAGIQRQRGGGQVLERPVKSQMESAFGTDFSSVRVHADTEANKLNEALNARAFTTGQDIFFRQGEYSPNSSQGKELLAHELTHVVQQAGGIQGKLKVSQPGDKSEQEADRMARAIVQSEQLETDVTGSSQQIEEENNRKLIQAKRADVLTQPQEENQQPAEGPEKRGVTLEVGGGAPTTLVPPPLSLTESMAVQTKSDGLIQRNGGTAVAAAALGYEILKGAVATMQQGDLKVTWPNREVGVIANNLPSGIRTGTITNSKIIFNYRKTNPISGIEQVNIQLRCTIQYNGAEVQGTFGFTAGGQRSRLLRDSEVHIRNPLSLQTVPASPEWQRAGIPAFPVVRIPIEILVNHPWPQSNDNWTFSLVLGGMYGFGITEDPNDHIEDFEHVEN